ncbi:helix-turn-helix domain-containing protein [Tenacibaculum agarivorans]|uniref:helix-turn-helix domain-containing protein n=1 Tax=Tenacibaculum agarivorans TaxID=1908389 RepID=UPI00094BB4E5|nr:helix-turn-helix transcriptional regulator [Tenacibaculum agarivorans]
MINEDLTDSKDIIQRKVGNKIQSIRESKGLSQVDLAGKIQGKFDTTNVSRIESGRTNSTLFTLYRISKALEVPLTALVDIDTE